MAWARLDEVVFVDEDEELISCSGRFSGELVLRGKTVEIGPQAVFLPDALAWAAERTPVVVVRVGPDRIAYSAGQEAPAGWPMPAWPAGGLRDVDRWALRRAAAR